MCNYKKKIANIQSARIQAEISFCLVLKYKKKLFCEALSKNRYIKNLQKNRQKSQQKRLCKHIQKSNRVMWMIWKILKRQDFFKNDKKGKWNICTQADMKLQITKNILMKKKITFANPKQTTTTEKQESAHHDLR